MVSSDILLWSWILNQTTGVFCIIPEVSRCMDQTGCQLQLICCATPNTCVPNFLRGKGLDGESWMEEVRSSGEYWVIKIDIRAEYLLQWSTVYIQTVLLGNVLTK